MGARVRRPLLLSAGLAFLLLLCAPWLVSASDNNPAKHKRWKPEDFPNPQKDLTKCGRRDRLKSSLCDPENILTPQQHNMVDGLVNEIASGAAPFKTAACGAAGQQGFQVAVAVFHRMDLSKHADKAATAERFARALHDSWGVGNPDCQNGALLLLAVGDRQAYISTGEGVKAVVTEAQLVGVLDAIKPALKHKRYAEAILSCVQQLGLLASGQTPEPGGVDSDDGLGIFLFFLGSTAAVMGWAWLSNRKRSKRYKACADKLAAIKRDQAAIRRQQYASSSCPICLEDFDTPLTAAGAAAAARAAASVRAPAPAPPSPSAPAGSSADAAGSSRAASATRRAAAAAAGGSVDVEMDGAADGDGSSPSAPLLGAVGGSGAAAAAAGPSSSSAGEGAPGASGSKDRKGGKAEGKPEGRTPLVLRCGHAFCDPCITKWLATNTSCPICRKDLDASDDQPSSSNADSRRQQQGQPGQSGSLQPAGDSCSRPGTQVGEEELLRRQVWLPELAFRLRRLHFMYPDFVTNPMVYAWEEEIAADRDLDTSIVQAFDPARQQQLEEYGRGGASVSASFGGGHGSGGAGSSW